MVQRIISTRGMELHVARMIAASPQAFSPSKKSIHTFWSSSFPTLRVFSYIIDLSFFLLAWYIIIDPLELFGIHHIWLPSELVSGRRNEWIPVQDASAFLISSPSLNIAGYNGKSLLFSLPCWTIIQTKSKKELGGTIRPLHRFKYILENKEKIARETIDRSPCIIPG